MVDWYRTMAELGGGDAGDGATGGRIPITSRLLTIIGLLLVLLCGFHLFRLASGSISWFGVETREVRAAPEWMHTPVSRNVLSEGFGVSLPVVAMEGQEIIIRYRLGSPQETVIDPNAWVQVSCFCPVSHYGYFRITRPGSGEFVMPVTATGLYSVRIGQSAGPAGERSSGRYVWGVQSARSGEAR